MRKIILMMLLATLIGCNHSANDQKIDKLELRIQQLEDKFKETGNWVLWKRSQNFCRNCLYDPARAVSAYATRADCVLAATKLIEPNCKAISNDPIEIDYGDRHLYLNCLPPNVDGGK